MVESADMYHLSSQTGVKTLDYGEGYVPNFHTLTATRQHETYSGSGTEYVTHDNQSD